MESFVPEVKSNDEMSKIINVINTFESVFANKQDLFGESNLIDEDKFEQELQNIKDYAFDTDLMPFQNLNELQIRY